jgi:hypothetical protein
MKILTVSGNPSTAGNFMTETSQQIKDLAGVITVNLVCLVVFIAFCAVMTFGSTSLMVTYWNEHRAASLLAAMAAILVIPGLVEIAVARWGFWRRWLLGIDERSYVQRAAHSFLPAR